MTDNTWCKRGWDDSVSSHCWSYTPYDVGWDSCPEIALDKELQEIVGMEQALDHVPAWARDLVDVHFHSAAPCCHYLFPEPYLRIIEAIGEEVSPEHVHSCYAVESRRKREAQDYCLCLDAWLAGTSPKIPARELQRAAQRKVNWVAICEGIWDVLGEPTKLKQLLVERLLHTIRWQIKFCVWDDDQASVFCRDQFLGAFHRDGALPDTIDNYRECISFASEASSPRIKTIELELSEIVPNANEVLDNLLSWWLCAPKAFRFLEGKLSFIGLLQNDGTVSQKSPPHFLECLDTYASHKCVSQCWRSLCGALEQWCHDRPVADGEMGCAVATRLGKSSPVKRWLVRLFLRKLRRLEENDEELTHYVCGQSRSQRDGMKPIVVC